MNRTARPLLITIAAAITLSALCAPTFAQCAMCKAAVDGTTNTAAFVKSLNLGVLVLLLPPVTIFCSIFVVAFKNHKSQGESLPKTPEEKSK